jgi:hypothetical protein
MKPVTVQVITYAPTIFAHCQHCELTFKAMGIGERLRRQEAAESLPDDLARDFQALSDWVHALLERYGRGVRVRVIDAVSIEGALASIRHGVGRYPAVIVDGRRSTGSDFSAVDRAIERRLTVAGTG